MTDAIVLKPFHHYQMIQLCGLTPKESRFQEEADTPRSYMVEVPSGELRRNRAHIRPRTDLQSSAGTPRTEDAPATYSRPITRSQTGTARSSTISTQDLEGGDVA